MEITTGNDFHKIPKLILRDFKRQEEKYGGIEEFIEENIWEYLTDLGGKLVDKDMATFLYEYVTDVENAPSWGGYCTRKEMTFEDDGRKYGNFAFGWNNDGGEPDVHMLAYKEKRRRIT